MFALNAHSFGQRTLRTAQWTHEFFTKNLVNTGWATFGSDQCSVLTGKNDRRDKGRLLPRAHRSIGRSGATAYSPELNDRPASYPAAFQSGCWVEFSSPRQLSHRRSLAIFETGKPPHQTG